MFELYPNCMYPSGFGLYLVSTGLGRAIAIHGLSLGAGRSLLSAG